jgi:hypothetical protein
MRNLLFIAASLTACSGSIDMGGDDVPVVTDVQMTVRDGNVPVAGARVVFQDASEAVIADVVTDGAGLALAEMPDGGTVTVFRTYPPAVPIEDTRPTTLFTYVGVKPGDRLELGEAVNETAPAQAINVMVPMTAQGNINVKTQCGEGNGTAPLIPLTVRGCGGNLTVYVTDGDDSSFAMQAPFSENVDVSSGAFLGSLGSTISALNLAVGSGITLNVEKRLEMDNFTFFSTGNKTLNENNLTADVTMPALTNVNQLLITRISDGQGRQQMVAERKAYQSGTTVVDATMPLIPYVSNVSYAPTGISWVEQGPAQAAADAVFTTFEVTRDTGGQPPTLADRYVRAIIAPWQNGALDMPRFSAPADTMYNPGATDQIAGQFGIVRITGGGYDLIRSKGYTVKNITDAAPMDQLVNISYAGGNAPGFD